MQQYTDIHNISAESKGCVLAIGNFDGVHSGHRQLLEAARAIARGTAAGTTGVLTFEPHPRRLFRPDEAPFRLTPAAAKARKLAECGVDILFSLHFDWDFASQSAEQFIARILTDGIAPAHIVVGADFRFGQLRKGDPDALRAAGFPVTVLDKVRDEDGDDISASAVRHALRRGEIAEANTLLGWEWEIEGTVVKGDQRGRTIGYPTANVQLGDTLHPSYGIYATWVKVAEDGDDAPWLPSVTNIGIRPMFEVPVGQVETYIFDFNRDIYGRTLRIRPVRKLRGEARFASLDDLVAQIGRDCADARDALYPE